MKITITQTEYKLQSFENLNKYKQSKQNINQTKKKFLRNTSQGNGKKATGGTNHKQVYEISQYAK